MSEERRRHRTWGERFFMEPIYYWFDLYGADTRPSHTKVMNFLGVMSALAAALAWGFTLAETEGGINGAYVTLVLGILAATMGKSVFEKIVGFRSKGGDK